jgi:putative PIN family toxin of toxin-antitoxin system
MAHMSAPAGVYLVLDTNIVLDLLVYQDRATAPLADLLALPATTWLATAAMREELKRVLAYPQIARRLAAGNVPAGDVLLAFDRRVSLVDVADRAPYVCKDADDQKFIDLAAAHQACLLSKDGQVLALARRLARLGVVVSRQWSTEPPLVRIPA